jgi:hypothetical protein
MVPCDKVVLNSVIAQLALYRKGYRGFRAKEGLTGGLSVSLTAGSGMLLAVRLTKCGIEERDPHKKR